MTATPQCEQPGLASGRIVFGGCGFGGVRAGAPGNRVGYWRFNPPAGRLEQPCRVQTGPRGMPLAGVVPLCPSFDTVGPLAQTVADAALAYAALGGAEVDLRGAS